MMSERAYVEKQFDELSRELNDAKVKEVAYEKKDCRRDEGRNYES